MTDFDFIIVGTGPAGISAAYPILESGKKVLLVDGGRRVSNSPPEGNYTTLRFEDDEQRKWQLKGNLSASDVTRSVSPKFRTPMASVFEKFDQKYTISSEGFSSFGGLAVGGLANFWGAGVARLENSQLQFFGDPSEMNFSYDIIANRIGISGVDDDDLAVYFGNEPQLDPAVQLGAVNKSLYEKYNRKRRVHPDTEFTLGRSRLAVISKERENRKGCTNLGTCLWGCRNSAIYSPAQDIEMLRKKRGNLTFLTGAFVDSIERDINENPSIHVETKNGRVSFSGKKLILAAGTLGSSKLVLQALGEIGTPVQLLSNPSAAFLLWSPKHLGYPKVNEFALGQLSFVAKLDNKKTAFGSLFATTGLPVSDFSNRLPFSTSQSIDLARAILSSSVVGNAFLEAPSFETKLTLEPDASVKVTSFRSPTTLNYFLKLKKNLRMNFLKLGALLIPNSFTVSEPGSDLHYSGTFPHSKKERPLTTSENGSVFGMPNVHIVDGSVLPFLSEKSHTYTIMANADRIARQILKQYEH